MKTASQVYQPSILLLLSGALCFQNQKILPVQQPQTQVDVTQGLNTFQQSILPLLKTSCSPCHFEGGKVYGRYPFNDYATVKLLGKTLNTRLKEQERKALLTDWLNTGAREQ